MKGLSFSHNREIDIRVLQIFFIFIIPVFLLAIGIIPSSARIFVLLFGAIMMYGIAWKEGWSYKDFGFRVDNIKKSIFPYTLFTTLGVVGIIFVANTLGYEPEARWFEKAHFLYIFLVVSILQEFAFRSFLIPILKDVFMEKSFIIITNALLFMFIHIIYPVPGYGLPISFLGGIFFAWLYLKYPNFYLISISHAILNFLAVLYGFFVIVK